MIRTNIPLVSVIMSAYNVEKYILEAVNSILGQSYKNLEIVIADDGSTDGTRMIIDLIDDPRVKRYHNDKNMGLLYTWNNLLTYVQGEYITFQDGDDFSFPERIEKLVLFLESNPEVGLCGTNFIRYFNYWGLYQVSNYPLNDDDIRKQIKAEIIPFNGTRVMVRRDVYLKVGGFREFFKGLAGEDFDWILRIAEFYKVANIPEALYEYRYFPSSASKYSVDSPVERVYVNKIIFFLADQRGKSGSDALQRMEYRQISEYLAPFELKLSMDKTNYWRYNKVFSNALSNRDFLNAARLLGRRLIQYPLQTSNFFDLYRISFGFVRTLAKSLLYKVTGKSKYKPTL